MTRAFTGVGSRETPPDILAIMREVACKLVLQGWTLRSGGADGADYSFACGWGDAYTKNQCVAPAEIYLPWRGYNNLTEKDRNCVLVTNPDILNKSKDIIRKVHPAPDRLSRGALALHVRNCFQVMGQNLDTPSNMLICWTPVDSKGEPSGGTRTAIKIAENNRIPVRNLFIDADLSKVLKWLSKE